MSIAVYDTANSRVDHTWSLNDGEEIAFTKYHYNALGDLVFTVSGDTRSQVEGLTGVNIGNVATLTQATASSVLASGMSIAVYDTTYNRIDHIWSSNDQDKITFTGYFYNTNNELVYTLTGSTRTAVETVTGITLTNVSSFDESDIALILDPGMSLAVYDIGNNRVEHTWSYSDSGDITFTSYNYDALGKLLFTVSAESRSAVEGLTGVTIDNAATLTQADIDANLASGMSIAVYDTINTRVDHVWSRSDSGEASFTQYVYNTTGDLVFTLSGTTRVNVETIAAGINISTVATLDETQVDGILGSSMTLTVYDTVNKRVDHIWSRNDNAETTFTKYYYNSDSEIVYTLSGKVRADVEGLSSITISNVASLTAIQIDSYLGDEMTLAVYDVASNRVDYVWSKNEYGDLSFTKYFYNTNGDLAYTVTGSTKTEVESVVGITLANVATLTDTEAQNALAPGMSLAVYDTVNNRIEHVWSRADDGDTTFTEYNYDTLGKLVFTVSGSTRTDVESLSGVTVSNVAFLTESDIDTLLSENMSIAVYDTAENRIDHVWSRSATGEATFTQYFYRDATDGALVYTVSGATRSSVENLTGITINNVATLTAADIDANLGAGMSIAVYDTVTNKVDHVWTRDDNGKATFTQYFYNTDGDLVYTLTGASKADVEAVTTITLSNVATLTETQVNNALSAGMAITVYDVANQRVDHLWSRNDSGDLSFTQYYYNNTGLLVYTVTASTRNQATNVPGLDTGNAATLTDAAIGSILSDGMSIAVYDTANERIDHVWSRSDSGNISFTKYKYDGIGKLVFTISGDTRSAVEGITFITVSNVATLTEAQIATYLGSGMSLAVYDTVNNRIDHVWSRSDSGDTSYTKYHYDTFGKLVYTVTGQTRSEVENLTGITVANVTTLTVSDIDSYLGAGMSIAVYNTMTNRVDHIWSRDDSGKATFTQYYYNTQGDLVYTLSGASRSEVEAVSGITLSNVNTLDASAIASMLSGGMSLAVYSTTEDRISFVWSVNTTDDVSYTEYYYNTNGDLVYTVTGATRAEVQGVTGITLSNVASLSASDIENYIDPGMSVAVYDTANNRVDHVWSRSDSGQTNFTQYFYDSNGDLAYTITGSTRADVEGVSGININTVDSLTESAVDALLGPNMSLAVYDRLENRVEHTWQKTETGDVTYTQYYYDTLGKLVFTLTGEVRADVENQTAITVSNVATRTEAQINTALNDGMSLAVYDTLNNRVDYVWSKDTSGKVSFTQYFYNNVGNLVYTISGETRADVEGVNSSTVNVNTVATLSESDIDSVLFAGMSIAVYNISNGTVDHVWNRVC